MKREAAAFGALWLQLLRQLTDETTTWMVWKNADSALSGAGDVDAAASPREWAIVERDFRRWAFANDLGPITACPHIPGGLNLIAMPHDADAFLEMGVKERRSFRGSQMFAVDDLQPLTELDPRGFRRLRPGAEGLFKLFLNGMRPGGRCDDAGLRAKRVRELVRADRDGARAAALLFGPAAGAALDAADAAAGGQWDRGAALRVETWCLARGVADPGLLARRLGFRAFARQRCPIVAALLGDRRRMPGDRARWLHEVGREHALATVPPA